MSARRKPNLAIGAASHRPTLIGRSHAVASGHYYASMAAMRVLDRGGNAIDAGVTAAMALAVLQPDIVSFAGVAPTLIYLAAEDRVVSLAGLGWWPAATDVARLRRESSDGHVPEGLLRTVIPAAPATHIEALRRWGTISFEEAATPAMELARDGFPVYPLLAGNLLGCADLWSQWPSSAAVYVPGGRSPRLGELFVQRDLGATIAGMIDAERHATGDRATRLRAAHDHFYRGPVAEKIVAFHEAHGGFMRRSDLAAFEVPVEAGLVKQIGAHRIHMCDVWCQGIVLPQALATLAQTDLHALGHNSAPYLHTVISALDLAFADREAYVGDPKFVDVPVPQMLSDEYARRQFARIDPARSFGAMPAAGDPRAASTGPTHASGAARPARASDAQAAAVSPDTIYAAAADRFGNAYSATLSDTSYDTPTIPGTGLAVSSRGCQNRLDPAHPSVVAAGKRPRLTPAPAMAFRDGRFFMAWGTPGGDVQMQAMLQVFLNVTVFGKRLQEAIEAPRANSKNFPDSFAPHSYYPGKVLAEQNLPAEAIEGLHARGHDVEVIPVLPPASGAVCAVLRDPDTGLLHAGADPRREAYALAW
jgi:gamma-glutamyltranspeptidase / glutathione hydrolase